MADIALIPDSLGEFDLCIENGEPRLDGGFDTAVLIALFSDRRALPDDDRPDVSANPRGWWADALPGNEDLGSRLWLLSRAKTTTETLRLAEDYCQEALRFLLDSGAADDVRSAARREGDRLLIDIDVTEATGDRRAFRLNWEAQRLERVA